MPRAHRHFIPGYIWLITHRCHKKEFLLKFVHDRQRFIHWLYQARKRFDVKILNFAVTSNHVHILVKDDGEKNDIPATIQLEKSHGEWVEEALNTEAQQREDIWTQTVAVGSSEFVSIIASL